MIRATPFQASQETPCPLPGQGERILRGASVAGRAVVLSALAMILTQECIWAGTQAALGQESAPAQGSATSIRGPAIVERRLGSMGTGLEISVWGADRNHCLAASELAVRALEGTEARLSTWIGTSEFSALNRAPLGKWQDLTLPTAQDLGQALQLSAKTGGLFDPTLGQLVQAWDLRGAGRRPCTEELAQARSLCGYEAIEVDGLRARRLRPVILEEGAFGKGAGLDRATQALIATHIQGASLNLGGQWAFVGEGPWPLELSHPTNRTQAVLSLSVAQGSLATSANSERKKIVDGQEFGHLLDPATGIPSNATHSVSVFAESAFLADALSTALFIDPSQAAKLAQLFEVEVILLEATRDDLIIHMTPGLMARCRPLVGTLRVISLQPSLDF